MKFAVYGAVSQNKSSSLSTQLNLEWFSSAFCYEGVLLNYEISRFQKSTPQPSKILCTHNIVVIQWCNGCMP